MLATKIFPQTFRNFQQMVIRNKMVQEEVLNTTTNPFTQFHIANLYSISNLISLQLAQLQKDHVINTLQSFNFNQKVFEKGANNKISTEISYDETSYFFRLRYFYQIRNALPLLQTIEQIKNHQLQLKKQTQEQQPQTLQVQIKIRNCQNEKIDHPSVRKTLYFHQLKDLDKYVTFKPLPKTPLFIEDMHRKKLQMKVLDQRNPYGFPTKAPPLIFDVELGNKVYIRLKSTYEMTNIIEVGSLKKGQNNKNQGQKKKFRIDGMKLPRTIQETIFKDIINSLLMIDDAEMFRFHQLAYIGGRVQKLNTLMQLHETMTMEDEDLFQEMIGEEQ